MGQRGLLLPRDKGGAPHGAAVAVPEPAYGGRRRVRGATEPVVRLGLSGERRSGAPHRGADGPIRSVLGPLCEEGGLTRSLE